MKKIKIIKAPTGFGKTRSAFLHAKEKKMILAVPTVRIADEVEKRAKKEGLKVIKILGRNNYICGYKAKLAGIDIKKYKRKDYKADDFSIAQDIVCCGRQSCQFDPFNYFKQKMTEENPDIIVTTHSLLKTSSFKPILQGKDRTLTIDEIHTFIKNLKEPTESTRISLQSIRTLLQEISQNKDARKSKESSVKAIKFIEGQIKKIPLHLTGQNLAFIVDKNGVLKKFSNEGYREYESTLLKLKEVLKSVRNDMPRKSKNPPVISLREKLSQTINTIDVLLNEKNQPGFYGYIRYSNNNVEFGLKQILFSSSMWLIFNRIMKSLNPEEIIGMSATIDKKITDTLFKGSKFEGIYEFEETEFSFNSRLKMIIVDTPFDYENKYQHLNFIADKIKEIKEGRKGIVILATSYEDIEYLYGRLKDKFKVIRQKNGEDAEEILNLYEKNKAQILIGNKSFWEGINIRRNSIFAVVKMPYFSPSDIDFVAVKEYMDKNSFMVNKKDSYITLVQGLGRIIRNDNEEKKVYIFDNRIKDFTSGDFKIISELPALVELAFIKENSRIKHKKAEKYLEDKIKKMYYYTFKEVQEAVIRGQKIDLSEFSQIVLRNKGKDKRMAKFFAVEYKTFKKNQLYSKIYTRIIVDFINLYQELGLDSDIEYIANKTGLSYTSVKKVVDAVKKIKNPA